MNIDNSQNKVPAPWQDVPWERWDDWHWQIANRITSVEELSKVINITDQEVEVISNSLNSLRMAITPYYASLMDPDDERCPIRMRAAPTMLETIESMGDLHDPLHEDVDSPAPGLTHRYPDRVLLLVTDQCSMYCRHCFRKRIVGLPNDKTVENFQHAAKYINEHKEITNVIISGGDPFMISTSRLKTMLKSLIDIKHINYVRIGTRTPVVYPIRFFDDELIEYLKEFNKRKTLYIPTHFNHINEITDIAQEAVLRIREAGITVNNQAVFLKGVNDSIEEIENLMNGLVRIGVNPYYLYQCMPVSRVRHHFQVPLKKGINIVDKAKERLDGYAKRFKFIMGHDIGKIEICGRIHDKLILKQIHSRPEEPHKASRMMVMQLDDKAGWLDDMQEIKLHN